MRLAGYTGSAGTTAGDADEDTLYGREFDVTLTGGIVVPKISALLDGMGSGSGGQVVTAGLWDDAGDLIATSAEVQISDDDEPAWLDFTFDPPVELETGTYSEALHFGGVDAAAQIYLDGTTDGFDQTGETYADGLPTLSTSHAGSPAIFATFVAEAPIPDADDLQLARLAFRSAQRALGDGQGPIPGTRKLAVAGWHGKKLDPEAQGSSVAIVQLGGPLEDLLGQRIMISTDRSSVVAYVHNALDLDTGEDISLSRRLFGELGLLSETELRVTVDTLGS